MVCSDPVAWASSLVYILNDVLYILNKWEIISKETSWNSGTSFTKSWTEPCGLIKCFSSNCEFLQRSNPAPVPYTEAAYVAKLAGFLTKPSTDTINKEEKELGQTYTTRCGGGDDLAQGIMGYERRLGLFIRCEIEA